MISNKALKDIKDAKARYENAVASGIGKDARKREYMNTIFNHSNALIEAAMEASTLEAKVKELEGVADSLMAALEAESSKQKTEKSASKANNSEDMRAKGQAARKKSSGRIAGSDTDNGEAVV